MGFRQPRIDVNTSRTQPSGTIIKSSNASGSHDKVRSVSWPDKEDELIRCPITSFIGLGIDFHRDKRRDKRSTLAFVSNLHDIHVVIIHQHEFVLD